MILIIVHCVCDTVINIHRVSDIVCYYIVCDTDYYCTSCVILIIIEFVMYVIIYITHCMCDIVYYYALCVTFISWCCIFVCDIGDPRAHESVISEVTGRIYWWYHSWPECMRWVFVTGPIEFERNAIFVTVQLSFIWMWWVFVTGGFRIICLFWTYLFAQHKLWDLVQVLTI